MDAVIVLTTAFLIFPPNAEILDAFTSDGTLNCPVDIYTTGASTASPSRGNPYIEAFAPLIIDVLRELIDAY